MKPIISISCLFILIAFSVKCRKNQAVNPFIGNATIVGSWELRHIEGVQIPSSNPNYPAGNGNIWKFTTSGYQFYIQGQLRDSGLYTIVQAISPVTGKTMNELILNSDYSQGLFFQISSGTLTLYQGLIAYDGNIKVYTSI